MIPAGLGADDRRFLLRNAVCKVCNTAVFSPLELEWLRNSPTAIARVFMQEAGRQRGRKRQPPKLGAGPKVVITPQGDTAEAEIGFRGKATILPQLILAGERQCRVAGSDGDRFRAFMATLSEWLGPSVLCARKSPDFQGFDVATLVWADHAYVVQKRITCDALPESCLLCFQIESDADGRQAGNSRIFQRGDGQFVLRLRNELTEDRALTLFRKAVAQMDLSTLTESDIEHPLISVSLSFRFDVTGRVLAKTGLNMLAHLLGTHYVSHPAFQDIKRAILTGEPVVASFPESGKTPFRNLFSGLPDTHHAFLLSVQPSYGDACGIGMVARLYGSQVEVVMLARGLPFPRVTFPIVFTVDYQSHRIAQYSLMEYMQAYPASLAPNSG
jgi:hypothetical protein